ncbi:hypothetical protein TRVA0_053S00892 [Trichomonascus vanleenenianus]|uniref:uncharacterized protein n=1 Tax=Trichomonascus vanleenenianus TaxID=2268995 RepID=UPI003ECA4AB0
MTFREVSRGNGRQEDNSSKELRLASVVKRSIARPLRRIAIVGVRFGHCTGRAASPCGYISTLKHA